VTTERGLQTRTWGPRSLSASPTGSGALLRHKLLTASPRLERLSLRRVGYGLPQESSRELQPLAPGRLSFAAILNRSAPQPVKVAIASSRSSLEDVDCGFCGRHKDMPAPPPPVGIAERLNIAARSSRSLERHCPSRQSGCVFTAREPHDEHRRRRDTSGLGNHRGRRPPSVNAGSPSPPSR
jgi:hypothetical protein